MNNSIMLPNNVSTENTNNQINYSTQMNMLEEGSQGTGSIEDSILRPDICKRKRTFQRQMRVSKTQFNNSPVGDKQGSIQSSAI